MSTANLHPHHFAAVARAIAHHARSRDWLGYAISHAIGIRDQGCGIADAAEKLADTLQQLNAQAHGIRYRIPAPVVRPVRLPAGTPPLHPAALVKALECIAYNCDDGQEMTAEHRAALQIAVNLTNAIRRVMVESLPEYAAADWMIGPPPSLANFYARA